MNLQNEQAKKVITTNLLCNMSHEDLEDTRYLINVQYSSDLSDLERSLFNEACEAKFEEIEINILKS